MVNYDKFDKIVRDDEEEEINRIIRDTEKLVTAFKDEGNARFGKGQLAEAVGQYTTCIVLLTGERDPRVKNPADVAAAQEKQKQQQKEAEKKSKAASSVELPGGMQAIDPTQMQQEADPTEPAAEMGQAHESSYAGDAEVQQRMERAAILLQSSEKLRELLASIYCNRALGSVQLSEGKDKEFKEKVVSQPGGVDKWDGYRVRMVVDSLNDARRCVQLNPKSQKGFYRIGYCIHRLITLIDRIRERKPWLREDEMPLLEKPMLWEEARETLMQSLSLCNTPAEKKPVYEKLQEVHDALKRLTCIVRKLGHENLGAEVNAETMVLESVDEGGPSKKWGLDYFIGCKITHLKVGDEGAFLPVTDVMTLSKRQTHASYVTLGFLPKKPVPLLPTWHEVLTGTAGDDADGNVTEDEIPEAPRNPANRERWGPPPPTRKRVAHTAWSLSMPLVGAIIVLLLSIILGFMW